MLSPRLRSQYREAVDRLRGMALAVNFYVRPTASKAFSRDEGGSALVQLPEQRLVGAEDDMAAHIRDALQLNFPQPEFDERPAADLVAAVESCFAAGEALPQWRAARVEEAWDIARSLREVNDAMLAFATAFTRPLVAGMNLAFMAAFVDAVGWPDVAVVERFARGFPIVGDIPDSGLFRPVDRPATLPLDSFTPEANRSWASSLDQSLTRRAAAATGDDRAALQELEAVTRKEARNGFVIGPRSPLFLDHLFGRGSWRPMRRFGIWQGEGDAHKVRAIDNAKGNDVNRVISTWETIYCMTLFFIVVVAGLFRSAATAARASLPRLQIGLDDMRAAYRRIPVDAPWMTVFAMWSFVSSRIVYYYLHGHNFGLVSSVVNFNRFPHLLVAMCRVLFAVPCDHFFDDYVLVDMFAGGSSGQEALASAHEIVGQSVEPKKRKPMADANVALGQQADVSQTHSHGHVIFSPTDARCASVLSSMRAARARNHLSTARRDASVASWVGSCRRPMHGSGVPLRSRSLIVSTQSAVIAHGRRRWRRCINSSASSFLRAPMASLAFRPSVSPPYATVARRWLCTLTPCSAAFARIRASCGVTRVGGRSAGWPSSLSSRAGVGPLSLASSCRTGCICTCQRMPSPSSSRPSSSPPLAPIALSQAPCARRR
jgi:hypothetical protein